MRQPSINIMRLEQVAAALDELKDKVVFVGGAVVELYLPPSAQTQMRPTKDVDCIVELKTRIDHSHFEEALRKHGFQHANMSIPGSPICRWLCEDVLVDIMPTEESVLGFSNRWYTEALRSIEHYRLPSGTEVAICSLPYFLATKFEAFGDRGAKDARTSTDLEDIVTLIDGVPNIRRALFAAPKSVQDYLKTWFVRFVEEGELIEGIECSSVQGFEQAERVKALMARLTERE